MPHIVLEWFVYANAVHVTAAIKVTVRNLGTKDIYILRGLTSCLRVLDVSVNKPFKNYMRQQFKMLMQSSGRKIEQLHIIQ